MISASCMLNRRWFKILKQFGRKLPSDPQEYAYMREGDRPMSESERERQDEMRYPKTEKQKRLAAIQGRKYTEKMKKQDGQQWRHASRGGSRWSRKPPSWYPRFENRAAHKSADTRH